MSCDNPRCFTNTLQVNSNYCPKCRALRKIRPNQHFEVLDSGFEVIEDGKAIIRTNSDGKTYWEHRKIQPEDTYWVIVEGKNYHFNRRETAIRFNETNRLKVPWPEDLPVPAFMKRSKRAQLKELTAPIEKPKRKSKAKANKPAV